MSGRGNSGRRGYSPPVVPIAPLIDVVFLLLIFFMLVTSFQNPALELTLPGSETATSTDARSVTIRITESGNLYLDLERIEWADLSSRISERKNEIDLVRISADRSTPYEDIIRAMDAIRVTGITGIAMEATIYPQEE
jgi:biopolymer transport protein ExbD